MNIIKRILIALGLMKRPVRRYFAPSDDRLNEVIEWIKERPQRRHIIAIRHLKSKLLIERSLEPLGIKYEVFSLQRLCTGIMFRDDGISLSCTTTLTQSVQYDQLTYRLRGTDPEYNVVLDPRVKVRVPVVGHRGPP